MSKSNVNPNHYKVAGRERQGEDIPQARNKQKHAAGLVRERAESDARPRKSKAGSRKSAPEDVRASTDADPTRSVKTATRKAPATPRRTPGAKRGHNLVPGSSAPHARFRKAKLGSGPRRRKT